MENEMIQEKAELIAACQGCGYSTKLTKKQLKQATIDRAIPIAVVDAGVLSVCVKPKEEDAQESVCGGYCMSQNSLHGEFCTQFEVLKLYRMVSITEDRYKLI